MSTKELREAIDKKLIQFSDKQLEEVLAYLREVEKTQGIRYDINEELEKVMEDDKDLLKRLAK